MAQDVVAPRVREERASRVLRTVAVHVRRVIALPPPAPQPRLAYEPQLVAYVVGTWVVAAGLGVVSFLAARGPLDYAHPDYATLALGGVTILLMAVYPIRHLEISWVPTTFVHLGLAVTFGPVGAAVGAVAEATGVAIRIRNGWFRTLFNLSSHFLANMGAWGVFIAINGVQTTHGSDQALLGGLAAGFTHWAVNSGSIAVVRHLSDHNLTIRRNLQSRLQVMPYSIAYGFAAFTFVIMHDQAKWRGFVALLAPVLVLHVYLIIFAWKSHQFAEANAEHQRVRLDLLRKEAEASERERTKIAGDLHDGVVQNLAGLAFALSAESSQLKAGSGAVGGREELIELLDRSASETRGAMKDLRTLIIDLAPPTLRREGLHAALLEVLRDMKRKGTNTHLDLPPNLRLRKDRAELIFRVAQEFLRNVAAHAEAKNVTVELTTEDGSAILSIQDDGKGFTPADVARKRQEGHLGSSAAVDRAEEAGGTLTIDSEPGRGTLVVLTLPIE